MLVHLSYSNLHEGLPCALTCPIAELSGVRSECGPVSERPPDESHTPCHHGRTRRSALGNRAIPPDKHPSHGRTQRSIPTSCRVHPACDHNHERCTNLRARHAFAPTFETTTPPRLPRADTEVRPYNRPHTTIPTKPFLNGPRTRPHAPVDTPIQCRHNGLR